MKWLGYVPCVHVTGDIRECGLLADRQHDSEDKASQGHARHVARRRASMSPRQSPPILLPLHDPRAVSRHGTHLSSLYH